MLRQVPPSPRSTSLATAMVLLLQFAALVLHMYPGDTSDVVAWTSTNLDNLADHPVAAMLTSTFVVPGDVVPELVIVAVSFAVPDGPWERCGRPSSRWPAKWSQRC